MVVGKTEVGAGEGGQLSTWRLEAGSRRKCSWATKYQGTSKVIYFLIKVPQTRLKAPSAGTKCSDTCAKGTVTFRLQQDASRRSL